jgi:hypothetical protein
MWLIFEFSTSQTISMVYAHEMGHALSLKHYPEEPKGISFSPNVAVMTPSTFQSILPQTVDKNHLKEKWGI